MFGVYYIGRGWLRASIQLFKKAEYLCTMQPTWPFSTSEEATIQAKKYSKDWEFEIIPISKKDEIDKVIALIEKTTKTIGV